MDKLYMKKYTVIGNVQDIGFHRGLRKQAFERYLHGFILNLKNGKIEIVVAGTDKAMVDEFKNVIWEDPERGQVREVHESFWDDPVKVGFEIKADLKTQVEQLKRYQQELEVTEHALIKAESKYKQYHDSLSWKVSQPIRKLGEVIKNAKK
jgi:cyanophycin synthetase